MNRGRTKNTYDDSILQKIRVKVMMLDNDQNLENRGKKTRNTYEAVVLTADGLGSAIGENVRILFPRDEKRSAYQELPPTPMTEMGEHPKPTRAVTSWRTMPNNPRIAAADLESA